MLSADDAEDQDLMVRIQRGEGAAFERLTRKYHLRLPWMLTPALWRAVCAYDDGLAEVTQEFWIKLAKGAHTYRAGSPVRPWLRVVLNNTARTFLRRRRGWFRSWREDEEEGPLDDVSSDDSAPTSAEDEHHRLRALVSCLRADERVLVDLYMNEHSLTEIATLLGITVNACRVRLHRIILKLRQLNELAPG